jgi:hypothetical protein
MKGINNGKLRFEPDAISDFCIILGDLNARFRTTYSDYIADVANAKNDV